MVDTSWQRSRLNNTSPRKENFVKKPEDRELLLVKNPMVNTSWQGFRLNNTPREDLGSSPNKAPLGVDNRVGSVGSY